MSSRGVDHDPTRRSRRSRTVVLRALVPAERRRLVSDLLDRSEPVGIDELSGRLAEDPDGVSEELEAVTSNASLVAIRLRQVDLPALSSAGVVSWDEDDTTVSTINCPALHDPLIGRVLAEHSDAWDDVIEALAEPRRRATVTILANDTTPRSPSDLSRELAVRVPGQPTDFEEIEVSLRHCHLPKLDAAGLVEYDAEAECVAFRGHPLVDGPWFDSTRVDPCSGQLSPSTSEEFGDD